MLQIYAFTSEPVALNSYLLIGDDRALVVDTGAGPAQASAILHAYQALTDLPLVVVNTHDHWDHFFGNATFRAAGVESFYGASGFIRDSQASAWVQFDQVPLSHEPDLPADPSALIVPATALAPTDTIELGGCTVRTVEMAGHSESDLLLTVDDVVLTGDLIEEGAPPQVGDDGTPARWASSLRELLLIEGIRTYLPGHGLPVDRRFVQHQADDMAALAADHTHALQELHAVDGGSGWVPVQPTNLPEGVILIR